MLSRLIGFIINVQLEPWAFYVKFVGIFFGIIALASITLLLIIWRANTKKKKLVSTNEDS